MVAGSKIALHHVGGRWGNQPFPALTAFAADFVNVLYEADIDAIPGIREACKDHRSELIVIPACLADLDGEAILHLYINPGLTSPRQFGSMLRHRYLHLFGVDHDFGSDGARLIEKRRVKTHTLDNLLDSLGETCPPPDFLSLDIQASEYEALLGARQTLRRHVCGVIAEIEFEEMYLGQKRFQELCDLLAEEGFAFVRFLSIGEAAGPAAPLGFRSSGYQSWADALFLRRADALAELAEDATEKLTKLCFVAIAFGIIELAIECLVLLRGRSNLPRGASGRAYEEFIRTLSDLYEHTEKIWPPVFSRVLPPHRSREYSRAASPQEWPQIFEGLRNFDASYLAGVERLAQTGDTEFEALLRHHGFAEQADRVNHLRRQQAQGIREVMAAANM